MDKAGESPVKRVKKTHRGRRSSPGQKERDQRNEKYYLGSFTFAWLAQNYGTANCNVAPTTDGNDQSIETERGIVGAGETTAGSPQDGWADLIISLISLLFLLPDTFNFLNVVDKYPAYFR